MQNVHYMNEWLKLLIKLLPMAFWILLILGFDLPYIAIMTLISSLIHELGHIAAISKTTVDFKLKSVIGGLRLKTVKPISYKKEIVIAIAGPMANLIVFCIFIPFYRHNDYLLSFGIINLLTALSNLLPIESYDGYRIILSTAMILGFSDTFINVMRKVSFILISSLSFAALYFMKRLDVGYWTFFIFIAILIKTIINDKKVFFARKREKK